MKQQTPTYKLNDFSIYGSSRLGVRLEDLSITSTGSSTLDLTYRELGNKRYELSNHLGNVLEVISDRKLAVSTSTTVDYYSADVISYSDYYPFGMLIPNRHGQDDDYSYGFNGMEKDDEVRKTKGASYDFGARMLDPRIGRWLSVDPLESKYPGFSPYIFVANNPIVLIDPDGREILIYAKLGDKKPIVYKPGMKYEGKNTFVAKTIENLNKINEGKRGADMITELCDSKKKVKIKQSKSGNNKFIPKSSMNATKFGVINKRSFKLFKKKKTGNIIGTGLGSGGTITYDINNFKTLDTDVDGQKKTEPYLTLTHELAHALQSVRGQMDNRRPKVKGQKHRNGVRKTVIFAVHWENLIRTEHGVPLRLNYGRRSKSLGGGIPENKKINYS